MSSDERLSDELLLDRMECAWSEQCGACLNVVNAELPKVLAELAAAQAREAACMERIKDALDCLPRALDGSRPFSLDQRAEVMLAIEALRAALAAAVGDA